jgi:porphobilinogen deaminase
VSGGGAFSSQLEQELLEGRIDVAVHSLKDLPTTMPDGLVLAVTPPREDIHDALCGSTLAGLRRGASVGTGSPRRITSLDGTQRVFASATGADAQMLGETLARTMLERGAEAILRQIRVSV